MSDTREGFLLHLQKLSHGIQVRVQEGESLDELARYARTVVRSDLIPDYKEFKRQLLSEERSRGVRLLQAGAKVLQIEAPISSPRFYGAVCEAFGVPWLGSIEKRRDSLTNRSLALQFMRQVEEHFVHQP